MKNFEIKRTEAQRLQLEGSITKAEKIYRYLISYNPMDCDVANLGAILRKQGRLKEAILLYKEWLQRGKATTELYLNAINSAIEANQIDLGEKWLQEGTRNNAKNKPLELAESRLLMAQGRNQQAISKLIEIKKRHSNDRQIDILLAKIYYLEGQFNESLSIYEVLQGEEETRLESTANMITILQELNRIKEASALMDSLDKDTRNNINIKRSIAFLILGKKEFSKAAKMYKVQCDDEPQLAVNWLNYCAAERGLKNNYMALEIVKMGIKMHPKNEQLKYALMQCLSETGKLDSAGRMAEKILQKSNDLAENVMFNIQFMGEGYKIVPSEKLQLLAHKWERKIQETHVRSMWLDYIRAKAGKRKIRIGYLSQDFCNHPVGRFISPIIKNHNRSIFKVYCISSGSITDEVTEVVKNSSDQWISIEKNEDITAAKKIASLQLDIIIELGGYTGGSRLGIICCGVAPIQLSYLGYYAPTYIKSIDGWIGDEYLFNDNNHSHKQAHRQLKVKDGYMAYEEMLDPLEKERVNDQHFRFGTFNHARKLTESSLELFSRIAKIDKNIKFVFKSISFNEEKAQADIVKRLNKYGVDEGRIEVLPWVDGRKAHLECYRYIDVAVDPFPYGGATTTCEALIMGVPVITLMGKSMVENLSASILCTSGKEKWVAKEKKHYVEIAEELYKEGIRTKEKRENLAQEIKKSNLGNTKRLVNNLEKIYLEEIKRLEKSDSR
ncbi:hypothetical protein FZZ91_01175 [Synechococcus sp. HB1133]|uniref:O-linked N-acetylglucosamine transferase family protein n=1 Tax=unclassified Synechococcus TaxID=2626047 RepID=UPI00140C5BD3|nr:MULTISPECIES: hypothetical protein [unclassified Synechococcus]MCB4421449.1 hypothetical protein [Synechococcus sp. HB1133]MCB4431200.1 hypothetical protein [Synechococcus sp. HBA1120]NHI80391.1 hypothetical protein [Synechococcus sp. HB1133]